MRTMMPAGRRIPPIWLMGFCNLPVGFGGAVTLVTIPQLLSAKGVSESAIAWITTLSLVAGFTNFLIAPVVDWRLSRRSYAIIMAVLSGLLTMVTLLFTDDLVVLAVLAFLLSLATYLNQAAVAGWLSAVVGTEGNSTLGAWLQAANVGGFGIGAAIAILLIRNMSPLHGAVAVGLLEIIPLPLYLWIQATPADIRLGHESFAAFLRDVVALLGLPVVRWLLFFLAMPAASFALSNTLAGLGKDFGASEELVGTVSGIGVAIAGVLGCVVVPPIMRGMSSERAYLAIGAGGAVFTLALILLPRTPLSFAIGMIGQNGIQAAAFAAVNIIILRANGTNNPLAATQYALLSAASGLPLSYMQAIDGQAYGHGGLVSSYLTDSLISLAACAMLSVLLMRRGRARREALVTTGI